MSPPGDNFFKSLKIVLEPQFKMTWEGLVLFFGTEVISHYYEEGGIFFGFARRFSGPGT